MSNERDEIRRGELSAQEASDGGYEVFSDDDPFGMPAGYVEPGADPQEAMTEMHRNAAEYEAEQVAGSGGGSGRVARKTLPIAQSRGVSSQAGLASIKRGLDYGVDYSAAPAPGEPGSRSNPVVVSREGQARRTMTILPDGRLMAPAPGEPESRPNPNPAAVSREGQARRTMTILPDGRLMAPAPGEPESRPTPNPAAVSREGQARRTMTILPDGRLIDSAAVQAVMGAAAPTPEADSVGKAAVAGFVNGAAGQLQSQAATKSQRSPAEARRQKMTNWAERIDNQGQEVDGLER